MWRWVPPGYDTDDDMTMMTTLMKIEGGSWMVWEGLAISAFWSCGVWSAVVVQVKVKVKVKVKFTYLRYIAPC